MIRPARRALTRSETTPMYVGLFTLWALGFGAPPDQALVIGNQVMTEFMNMVDSEDNREGARRRIRQLMWQMADEGKAATKGARIFQVEGVEGIIAELGVGSSLQRTTLASAQVTGPAQSELLGCSFIDCDLSGYKGVVRYCWLDAQCHLPRWSECWEENRVEREDVEGALDSAPDRSTPTE